ncbi:MAG: aminopeptidase P family protein [Candidatus Eiseniibacteriota bacterium]|nr:MAG: aminopeptidase P family protein [Candidatus Eisenbacteria bacterium]
MSLSCNSSLTSIRITSSELQTRAGKLLEHVTEKRLSGVVLFDNYYILYLTGFAFIPTERPIAFLMNARGEKAMFVPRLEREHAVSETGFERVVDYVEYPCDPHPFQILKKTLDSMGISGDIGADNDGYPWIYGYRGPSLSELTGANVIKVSAFLEDAMMIKSEAEVNLIRESVKWGNLAHRLLQRYTKVGATETEVSLRASHEATLAMLDTLGPLYRSQSLFHEGASAGYRGQIGRNAAIPHALANNITFQAGDVLVTGAGAVVWGYTSELERTMVVGRPSEGQREMFAHMKKAQEVAFDALRPGARCSDVDRAVRLYYEENSLPVASPAPGGQQRRESDSDFRGLMPFWKHHTGHAIGLRMHEGPFLDVGDHTVIRPRMVFTVEPGFYAPDMGGFRHSDTLVVLDDGIEILTYYPRELESLIID